MQTVYNVLDKYKLSEDDRQRILDIILPICKHEEFKKRMSNVFLHHSDITLGQHMLEDTVKTYLIAKKYIKKNKEINLSIALKISMLHDLYTLPWQNNIENKGSRFFTMHGFRHPIEAVINAINWYPEIFKGEDAKIIIDGIIHHMYPLPVISFNDDGVNDIDLKNFKLLDNLSEVQRKILVWSSNRNRIGPISLCRSKYLEGRIVARADKYVSVGEIKNISSAKALVTGKNKKIRK